VIGYETASSSTWARTLDALAAGANKQAPGRGHRDRGRHRRAAAPGDLRPNVRKRRVIGYRAGLRIDADDLQAALRRHMPELPPDRAEVNAAIRRHGGDFATFPLKGPDGWLLRSLTGGRASLDKPEYWMEMHALAAVTPAAPGQGKTDR
jgi:hypothetical protein